MDDLKLIKTHYGENMMHLCRELFPTLLETPGLLFETMSKKFAYTKFLYDDLIENYEVDIFKNIIYYEIDKERRREKAKNSKTPQELLDEAGYILYECKTEEDIQSFKKYYAPDEELCTFRGGRLNRCHVFFAVRKNVDEIKRENFTNPQREDEYGTSVMSLQFEKGKVNTLSIKNRYNHTLHKNPDATYGNNLDNIIEGLTDAFANTYGFNLDYQKENYDEDLTGYTTADDGKYYKYNQERNWVYYGPDNIIIDGESLKEYDKSRYIVFENFILDMKEKEIKEYESDQVFDEDSFPDGLQNIEKIEVLNNKEDKTKTIIINGDIIIKLDNTNQIIEYKNTHLTEIADDFLPNCSKIKVIDLPNVKKIGKFFMYGTRKIEKINLPSVEEIGNSFFQCLTEVKELNIPNIKTVGNDFLPNEEELESIDFPNLISVGDSFFQNNDKIKSVNLPNIEEIGGSFLFYNLELKELCLPKLTKVGDDMLHNNEDLVKLDLPEVREIGNYVLATNEKLKELNLPKVERIGADFLSRNLELESVDIPHVKVIEHNFLCDNEIIKSINMPELEEVGDNFLLFTNGITELNLPNLRVFSKDFMRHNYSIETVNLPKLECIGRGFIAGNNKIKEISLPSVETIYDAFLKNDIVLERVDLPNVKTIVGEFLIYADNELMHSLKYVNMPKLKAIHPETLYKLISLSFSKVPNSYDDVEVVLPSDIINKSSHTR